MRKKICFRNSILYLIMGSIFTMNVIFPVTAKAEEKTKEVETINSILEEGDILEMKNISDSKEIDLNTKSLNLPDGKYIINMGTGWVLGNDASLIKTSYPGLGVTMYIEESKVKIKEQTSVYGISTELTAGLLSASVEKEFGKTLKVEDTVKSDFTVSAPADKAIYAKLYATYNRYDLIEVKNNVIRGRRSTYEPEGSWLKYVKYDPTEGVDQSKLIERNNRCVLGESEEVDIKSSIMVGGNSENDFTLGFEFKNNSILFLNRSDKAINTTAGSNKYFGFKLLDKNKKEKISIEIKGTDQPSSRKFDGLDNMMFEIGDYIEIYHMQPHRLKYNNLIGSTQLNQNTQIYEITSSGLKEKEVAKNTISILGTNGSDAFKLELNHKLKTIEFKDRSNNIMSDNPSHQDTPMVYFSLRDKNGKSKYTMTLFGNDRPSDQKYNLPDNLKFEVGDQILLTVYHKSLSLISGYVDGGTSSVDGRQMYEVIEDGLKKIKIDWRNQ